ncbi:MAG TPA: NADH-quinone oxidoreductase subunit H [Thermoanaerobaculia bacterium]|nr:NADH-quinone oxidoreductase subunit H [Thermoanaerobaculia bacterium]HQR66071.1 NADH-quinone oxidoreductase subunit H [Thermoanaerobaculia bacterium]
MGNAALHLFVVLAAAPFLLGVIGRTKAAFAGRSGPSLLQPYHDLVRLFRKGSVLSRTTTGIFLAGPALAFAAPVAASLLVPFGGSGAPVSFTGDLVLFAYLFALSRFFTAAAALDTGSAFEGMGAAREVSFACLAEPTLFFGLLAVARITGALSLSTMLAHPLSSGWLRSGASIVLVVAAWFVVLLAENSRIPFDDPNTHLELTMIHEVMVLDHAGPSFGLVLWGAAVKLFVTGAVLVRIVMPFGSQSPWLSALVFLGGMVLLAVLIGIVESVMARIRLVGVPQLLVTACLLSAFGLLLLVRSAP